MTTIKMIKLTKVAPKQENQETKLFNLVERESQLSRDEYEIVDCITKIIFELHRLPDEYKVITDTSHINSITILFQVLNKLLDKNVKHLAHFAMECPEFDGEYQILHDMYFNNFMIELEYIEIYRQRFLKKLEILQCENIDEYRKVTSPEYYKYDIRSNRFKKISKSTGIYLETYHNNIFSEILEDYNLYSDREELLCNNLYLRK